MLQTTASSLSDYEQSQKPPADKLRFVKSPLVSRGGQAQSRSRSSSPGLSPGKAKDCRDDDHLPEFERHEEPTLLEIFFDLFFAANYNVFSDTQQVTSHARFKAYTGYFSILWLTWFLVTLFDVRYVTDSIFSRLTRAIQLGVLVGFAVVAPKFDPTNQHATTMQTMSLILMISRACLAVEYGSTLWHLRKFSKARRPLSLQIAIHSVAAVIYLAVSFHFRKGEPSRAYMAWYFTSGAEAILTILSSNWSPVLSLTKTHLMKRMTLLTVMIMGDGIVEMAKDVVLIVKSPDAWNSLIIGLVTATTATIYFVFLIYFDWLRSSFHLPAWRQQAWTCIHFPFHLSLVLFTRGFAQFLLWSKIADVTNRVVEGIDFLFEGFLATGNVTSQLVQERFNVSLRKYFEDYPPKIPSTWDTVNTALANLTQIPDLYWAELGAPNTTSLTEEAEVQADTTFGNTLIAIMGSMLNALYATFGINLEGDVKAKYPGATADVRGGGFQLEVTTKTLDRHKLVFATSYVAAASTLFFMIALTIVARTTPLKTWPSIRLAIIFLLALGTGLTALLFYSRERSSHFLERPWVLPTISLVWTTVLVLTHVNGEGVRRNAHLLALRWRSSPAVSAPPTPTAGWAAGEPKAADEQVDTDVDGNVQRRFPFSHAPDHAAGKRHDSHGAEDIGVAYGGSEGSWSNHDRCEASTDYKDASRV